LENFGELYGLSSGVTCGALGWRGDPGLRWPSVLSALRLSARDRQSARGRTCLNRIGLR